MSYKTMNREKLTEDKAEATPMGGVLVGKRDGQTMIHDKGSLSGYLVGRTHDEGGIKAVNKSTGQPLEMQGGEVVITAPAVSDTTKREFEGKMMTNREILSEINERGGGVSFAEGGNIPTEMQFSGNSYKYGGKTVTDHDIAYEISKCGCEHESLSEGGKIDEMPTSIKKKIYTPDGERKITPDAISTLTNYVNSLPQTKDLNTDSNGNYTKERQEIHQKIIDGFKDELICIQKDQPIAILMGGSPASGKSTFLRKYAPYLLKEEILKVDADEIRSMLPEYKGYNATQTHLETKDIVNTLLSDKTIGIPCKYDIIYDGTMNSTKSYLPLISLLKSLGYKIFIVYVDKVPEEVVKKRALERYKKSGRFVPMEIIDDFFSKGKTALDELKSKADGYMIIDGSSGDYNILEKKGIILPKKRLYSKLGQPLSKLEQLATGGHLAKGMSLKKIAKMHGISLLELNKQIKMGLDAESEHTSSVSEQLKIVKDHLYENPNYYTLLKEAGLEKGGELTKEMINDILDCFKSETQYQSKSYPNKRYAFEIDQPSGNSIWFRTKYFNDGKDNIQVAYYRGDDFFRIYKGDAIKKTKNLSELKKELNVLHEYNKGKYGNYLSNEYSTDIDIKNSLVDFDYAKGGEVVKNLPKIGSKVDARWDSSNRWVTGTFKGETKNGFEVYDFTIETPDHIEYYSEITEDSDDRNGKIFKSKNFKDRNYNNYHFTNEMADGGKVEYSLVKDAKSGNSPSRDFNNYNDIMDVHADNLVGAESGIFADGGALGASGLPLVDYIQITSTGSSLVNIAGVQADNFESFKNIVFGEYKLTSKPRSFVNIQAYDSEGNKLTSASSEISDQKNTVKNFNPYTGKPSDLAKSFAKSRPINFKKYDWSEWFSGKKSAPSKTTATPVNVVTGIYVMYPHPNPTEKRNLSFTVDDAKEFLSTFGNLYKNALKKVDIRLIVDGKILDETILGLTLNDDVTDNWRLQSTTLNPNLATVDDVEFRLKKEYPSFDFSKFITGGVSVKPTVAPILIKKPIALKNTKIWIGDNPELSRRVQERAMELGFDWWSGTKQPKYVNEKSLIFGDIKDISFTDDKKYFDTLQPHKEIFLSDFFDDTKLVEIPDEIANFDGKVGGLPTPIQTLLVIRSVEQNLKFGVKTNISDKKISSLQDDNGNFFSFTNAPEGVDFWYNIKNGKFKDFKEKYGIYGEKVIDIKINIPATATAQPTVSKTLSKEDLDDIKIKINSDFDLALKIVEKLEQFGFSNTSGIRGKIKDKDEFYAIWHGTGNYVGWFDDEDNFNDSDKKEIVPSDLGILSTTTTATAQPTTTSTALTEVQKNISRDNKITEIVLFNSVTKRNDTYSSLRSLYREIVDISSLINGATLDDFISFNFINGDGYKISETRSIFHGSSYDALFVDDVITKNEFFRAIFKNFPELEFRKILTLDSEREVYEDFKKSNQSAISTGTTVQPTATSTSGLIEIPDEIRTFDGKVSSLPSPILELLSIRIREQNLGNISKIFDMPIVSIIDDNKKLFSFENSVDGFSFWSNISKGYFKEFKEKYGKYGEKVKDIVGTPTTSSSKFSTAEIKLFQAIDDIVKEFNLSVKYPISELYPSPYTKDFDLVNEDTGEVFKFRSEDDVLAVQKADADVKKSVALLKDYLDWKTTPTSTAQATSSKFTKGENKMFQEVYDYTSENNIEVRDVSLYKTDDTTVFNFVNEENGITYSPLKYKSSTGEVLVYEVGKDRDEKFIKKYLEWLQEKQSGIYSAQPSATQAQTSTPLTGEEKLNREFVADYDPLRKNYLLNSSTLKNDIEDLNALATLLPSFQEVKFAVEKATILKEMGRLQKKIDYKGFIASNESVSKGADLFTPQGLLKYYFTQTTQNPTAELQPPCELPTPNGAKSKLPLGAYLNVRSSQFKKWFGDWERAYETDNYVNCSKMIDEETKEPKIFYHGVRKYIPSFGQMSNMGVGVVRPYGSFEPPNFPASYFADNESYANFYGGIAENMPKPSEGYKPFIYKVFMCVKNPISLLPLDFEISYKDLIDYVLVAYGIRLNVNSVLLKQLGDDMKAKHPIWVYIRRDIGLIETLKDYGYDALIQQGDIPVFDESGNPVSDRSKFIKDTEYLSFYPNQIKSATVKKSFYFNFFNDIRFKKGGYVCI